MRVRPFGMGKVIELFGDKLPPCVVCEMEADRLIFDVDVCDKHAVAVASFFMEAQRAMKLGGMDWAAMRRVVDFVAAKRDVAESEPS